jgi:organic radical activating enzyme
MTYSVKEIYYTLQGEGTHTGRPAVFLRFAGCNLWSGREEHRAEAVCRFCDTEFVGTDGAGGGKFETAAELADVVRRAWPEVAGSVPYVVCTGGEPLLQVDDDLISALHAAGFEIGVESNGTLAAPDVYPQSEPEAQPENFVGMDFDNFYLQPLDDPHIEQNTHHALEYCLAHPRWKLSIQTHKVLGID